MTERNRIIDAFRNCITEPKCKDCPWTECNTLNNGCVEIPRGLALAVMRELVAQEPHVMTLDEAANVELVWYDWRTRGVRPAKVNRVPSKTGTYRIQRFGDIDEWNHADEYGEYWRCWTSRPTDELRKATPWLQ